MLNMRELEPHTNWISPVATGKRFDVDTSCTVPPGWYKFPLTFLLYILVQKIKRKEIIYHSADDSSCQKATSFLKEMSLPPKKSSIRMPVTSMKPSLTQTTLMASFSTWGNTFTCLTMFWNKKKGQVKTLKRITDWLCFLWLRNWAGNSDTASPWGFQDPHSATSSSLGIQLILALLCYSWCSERQ